MPKIHYTRFPVTSRRRGPGEVTNLLRTC